MRFAIAVGMLNGKCEDFSQRVQWTPLLLVISIFACENTHSVALGLVKLKQSSMHHDNIFIGSVITLFWDIFIIIQMIYDIKLFDGRIPPRLPDCVDLRYILLK